MIIVEARITKNKMSTVTSLMLTQDILAFHWPSCSVLWYWLKHQSLCWSTFNINSINSIMLI